MPEPMLAQYNRWIFETSKIESVETVRTWIVQESDFQTIASETVQGLTQRKDNDIGSKKGKKDVTKTFFGNKQEVEITEIRKKCEVCGKEHGIWNCDTFKALSVQLRWEIAKQLKLCFHCLSKGHFGQTCFRSRVCGLNDCKGRHHRLLHVTEANAAKSDTKGDQIKGEKRSERSHNTSTTMESHNKGFVTLRTVPVIAKNGNRRTEVNALLDDGSTKTYLNADVAAKLGLEGQAQTVNISVLNGQVETFETVSVTIELESVDGSFNIKMEAFTTTRVTGNMQVIDWNEHSSKWNHLKEIKFPNIGPRAIVDLLIGVDHAELHCSYKDVCGSPGEPIARQTPL